MTEVPERSFSDVRAQLEDIVGQVRDRDISLERSLDLFEEAIRLGNDAFELIDSVEFSPEEAASFAADGAVVGDLPDGEAEPPSADQSDESIVSPTEPEEDAEA